jgi:L-rhamnose isomerase / sugar isomerase
MSVTNYSLKESDIKSGIELLENEFGKNAIERAINYVQNFKVEVPSWIFGDFGGGRFGEYMPPGCARNIYEKLDDASFINKITGAVEAVSTHTLWDLSDDGLEGSYSKADDVYNAAKDRGLKLGSMNPTYFLSGSHKGSLSSNNEETRNRYIQQTILSSEFALKYGSAVVSIWLPDGSNYPGQIDLKTSIKNTEQSLKTISEGVDKSVKVLIEYKVFEPGTYSTVLADWGSSYLMAKSFGPNAGILVDMGHHHLSTNIEQIVARVINSGISGGFHFNTRYAADDDHAVEPSPEMARIFYELVISDSLFGENKWEFMIDQCSGRENRMHAVIHTIDSLQLSLAKAGLVNKELLKKHQDNDELILANRVFNDALINADVRPIVAAARLSNNLPLYPMQKFVESRYQSKIEAERK